VLVNSAGRENEGQGSTLAGDACVALIRTNCGCSPLAGLAGEIYYNKIK
jgi:hypothetical protein